MDNAVLPTIQFQTVVYTQVSGDSSNFWDIFKLKANTAYDPKNAKMGPKFARCNEMSRDYIKLYNIRVLAHHSAPRAGVKPEAMVRIARSSLHRMAQMFPALFPIPSVIPDTHSGDPVDADAPVGDAPQQGGAGRRGGGATREPRVRRPAVRIGKRVHVPCSVFPDQPAAAEGFWRGRTVSVAHWPRAEQGGMGDIGVQCEGEGAFLWNRDVVATWVVSGEAEGEEGEEGEETVESHFFESRYAGLEV